MTPVKWLQALTPGNTSPPLSGPWVQCGGVFGVLGFAWGETINAPPPYTHFGGDDMPNEARKIRPDLADVVAACAELAEPIRAAIVAMVGAAAGKGSSSKSTSKAAQELRRVKNRRCRPGPLWRPGLTRSLR